VQSTQSALTHGSSGLVLGYLSVAIPMVVGLIRQQAPISKLLSVPLYAIPAALVAAIAVAMVSTVLRALGVPSDGFLQATFGVASFVAIGYASAYLVARSSTSDPSYRRGAVVMRGESANRAHRLGKRRPKAGSATDPNAPLTLRYRMVNAASDGEVIRSGALRRNQAREQRLRRGRIGPK
jgi:hypothetical protein